MKLMNWKHLVALVYYYYERPSLILLLFYKTSHILMIMDIWKYWNFYGKGESAKCYSFSWDKWIYYLRRLKSAYKTTSVYTDV